MSRIIWSSTWAGAGLQPPLFRLMRVRSTSNARAISAQYVSSVASSEGLRPAAAFPAWVMRASASARNAASAATPVRPPKRLLRSSVIAMSSPKVTRSYRAPGPTSPVIRRAPRW